MITTELETLNLKPETDKIKDFIFKVTPANIRQDPELNKQFIQLFEQTFGYKPSCTCSFFSDLQKLKNKLTAPKPPKGDLKPET